MNWLKLTGEDGARYINFDLVFDMFLDDNLTFLCTASAEFEKVKETPEEILKMLAKKDNN